jgi:hypothetical protein
VAGWAARAVSSSDKFLISTATRHFAEADYYQKQLDQVIQAGKKEKARGKN